MALGLAGLALEMEMIDMAALILVGFDAFLRTGELFGLRCFHINFMGTKAALTLGLTKSGKRRGTEESTVVNSPIATKMLQAACMGRSPTELVRQRSPAHCRAILKNLLLYFELDTTTYNWYSLRRGGAIAFFVKTSSMERTLIRGRWEAATTARIYIQEATASVGELSLSPNQTLLFRRSARHLSS